LSASLPVIILGLAFCAGCGMLCQAVSTGYVAASAGAGRSSAVGLYVTCYYIGGSSGAVLGGIAWTLGQWPACVALVEGVLILMALTVALAWTAPAAVARDG
jgi:predicted MFS family arabinose efflux permease